MVKLLTFYRRGLSNILLGCNMGCPVSLSPCRTYTEHLRRIAVFHFTVFHTQCSGYCSRFHAHINVIKWANLELNIRIVKLRAVYRVHYSVIVSFVSCNEDFTLFMTELCFMVRKDNVTRCMYTFGWSCTLQRCVGSLNHTPPWSPSSSLKSEATLWRHCRRRVRGPPWSDTSHTAPCVDTRPFSNIRRKSVD
jgi:hypothetical protein